MGNIEKKKNAKKIHGNIITGIVHISATFNNTIVSVTDMKGNVLTWSSAGRMGHKGTKKSTAFAAQGVASDAVKKAMNSFGIKKVEVWVKGPGIGRESAVRGVFGCEGVEILLIKDITGIPHNGCRPPKTRRV